MRKFLAGLSVAGERNRARSRPTSPSLNNRHNNASSKGGRSGTRQQGSAYDSDESDIEEFPDSYFQVPLQVGGKMAIERSVASTDANLCGCFSCWI